MTMLIVIIAVKLPQLIINNREIKQYAIQLSKFDKYVHRFIFWLIIDVPNKFNKPSLYASLEYLAPTIISQMT